jgi:ATP-binding cassette subfamily C (CFTR/MRP) protein 4
MGEMIPIEGDTKSKVEINGKVAYLAQKRWVIGATIKENILLGKEYDRLTMEAALSASQLIYDLKSLSHGIETILSDNGDTVSGGQRARIGLARCFYQK